MAQFKDYSSINEVFKEREYIYIIQIDNKLHTAYAYEGDAKKVEAMLARDPGQKITLTPVPMHWK